MIKHQIAEPVAVIIYFLTLYICLCIYKAYRSKGLIRGCTACLRISSERKLFHPVESLLELVFGDRAGDAEMPLSGWSEGRSGRYEYVGSLEQLIRKFG